MYGPSRARLTMEERNVDMQEGIKLRSVRRKLFPDDEGDEEEARNLSAGAEDNYANRFFEEARRSREIAKERWNFDFEKEEPLPGRYEWVKIDQHGNEISNCTRENDSTTESPKTPNQEMENTS
ncbi:hypothetical protein KM043_005737 [Ampulex compressa]|nr:hypothetical protein KM043_005737 [Ampulex compressa]